MIDVTDLSKSYNIKKLTINDIDTIYDFYKNNNRYFSYLDTTPSKQSVIEDMNETPNGISIDNKYFIGYYKENNLIAIIDLIDGYPNPNEAYIGLFMLTRTIKISI